MFGLMAASMLRLPPLSVQTFLVISLFEKLPTVLWKDEQALTCPTQFHFGRPSLWTISLLFFAYLREIMVSYKTNVLPEGWEASPLKQMLYRLEGKRGAS